MNALGNLLARIAVRRPIILIGAAFFLLIASLSFLRSHQSFDSDILNLLPAGTPAVEGLKIYNSQFNSARELAFLIEGASADAVTDEFIEALNQQPWVLRVLAGNPLESTAGRETLPFLVAPLILGQDSDGFDATLAKLDPASLAIRLKRLTQQTAAGSPLARLELINDPIGIVAPVAKTLVEKLSVTDTFNLTSVDGGARIVPVVTNQATLSADDCRALMQKVHAFIESFRKQTDPAVRISVTGRSAYVDEISESMSRDIAMTSSVSILAVTVLFWFAFRSLLPLFGSVLILVFTCLLSLTAGSLLFDKLNVVAIGFCSILIGLGDDFSLLLYQRYLSTRVRGGDRESAIAASIVHSAPGILWVALTTSLGFATLIFSQSAGFSQLGVLIAVGVFLGAIGMIFFMPLFERNCASANQSDPFQNFCKRLMKSSHRFFLIASLALGAALVLAIIPWRSLRLDTSTNSLEPRNIPAAQTLARMMEKFPGMFEPLMIVIKGPVDSESLVRLDEKLRELQARGAIQSFSSPSPLIPNRLNAERNAARLRALDLEGLSRMIMNIEKESGLRPNVLNSAKQLLEALESDTPLQSQLPAYSPWWFVLDRVLSPTSGDVIYYVRPPNNIGQSQRHLIEQEIRDVMPQAMVTGWSQMLNDLVPWALRELVIFGGAVVIMIFIILAAVYRRLSSLLMHVGSLALALGGTIATLKLFGHSINLLNILAFPLILGVGVDYGVHLILASRESGDITGNLEHVMKPVIVSGLTTCIGFGSLILARNPALSGLGLVCATGVTWCLIASICFLAPILKKRL